MVNMSSSNRNGEVNMGDYTVSTYTAEHTSMCGICADDIAVGTKYRVVRHNPTGICSTVGKCCAKYDVSAAVTVDNLYF